MTNVIPFQLPKANNENVIVVPADYFGSEKIELTDLFLILDEVKRYQKDNTDDNQNTS